MPSKYNLRADAISIFKAGIQAVDPKRLIKKHLQLKDNKLTVSGQEYDLTDFDNILVVGGGKAGAAMAAGVEEILKDNISDGLVITSSGNNIPLEFIRVIEAGHPIPDRRGVDGVNKLLLMLQRADNKTLVLFLISGGGSALLTSPVSNISLDQIGVLTDYLIKSGAVIREINTVRKHLSRTKGGNLAKAAFPARIITLILSDVIDDPLDVIASGPTVSDPTTFSDAQAVLFKYNLINKIPPMIADYIQKGVNGKMPETPKPGSSYFAGVQNILIGTNYDAIVGASSKAESLGYNTLILSSAIEGETREVARFHSAITKDLLKHNLPISKPACLISGGETTVTVKGNGKGGRNQEFVLSSAIQLDGLDDFVILSGGTDGIDGPTDAAGAICNGNTCKNAKNLDLDPNKYLANSNSYMFFKALGDLIFTGPTSTNVMDLRIILGGN